MSVEDLQEPEPPRGEWWSDEPQMETVQHVMTMLSLIATLRWHWRERSDYFVAGNLTIYFSPEQRKTEDFRGPDFFVVLGVDCRPRPSWVVWQEGGRYPNVIVELLSDTTEKVDRTTKKQIYAEIFRTPEYYLFDPHSAQLEGYCLVRGRYEPISPDRDGHLACDQLGLAFGVLDGQLRFYTPEGALVATPEESALAAQRALEQAEQRAEQAEAELQALRAKLKP